MHTWVPVVLSLSALCSAFASDARLVRLGVLVVRNAPFRRRLLLQLRRHPPPLCPSVFLLLLTECRGAAGFRVGWVTCRGGRARG